MTDSAIDLGLPAPAPAPATTVPVAPTTADQARATLEQRKADPEFVKRYLSGDHVARAEMKALHETMCAQPAGTVNVGGISLQAQLNDQADNLAVTSDVSAAVIEEVRSGRPATVEEYRLALGKKHALFNDPGWRARYFAGDHEAGRQKTLLDIILSKRVAL
jgi:hypothetical protein